MTGLGRRRICICTYLQVSESRLPELLQYESQHYWYRVNLKVITNMSRQISQR